MLGSSLEALETLGAITISRDNVSTSRQLNQLIKHMKCKHDGFSVLCT